MKLPCYKEGYAHVKCEANTWSYYPISIFFLYGCLGYCPLQLAVGSLQLLLWMSKHCCYLFWCLIFFFFFFSLFQNMAVSNCFQKWTMLWKIGVEHCWKMIFWVLYVRLCYCFPNSFIFAGSLKHAVPHSYERDSNF